MKQIIYNMNTNNTIIINRLINHSYMYGKNVKTSEARNEVCKLIKAN